MLSVRCMPRLASLTLVLPAVLTQSPAHDIALVPFINLFMLSLWEQETAIRCESSLDLGFGHGCLGSFGNSYEGSHRACGYCAGNRSIRVTDSQLVAEADRSLHPCALLIGGLMASPWFIAMERVSPGYLYYYFIDRHLLGFVTEGQEHGDSAWYYYMGPVLGGAMPWLMFAIAGVLQ